MCSPDKCSYSIALGIARCNHPFGTPLSESEGFSAVFRLGLQEGGAGGLAPACRKWYYKAQDISTAVPMSRLGKPNCLVTTHG